MDDKFNASPPTYEDLKAERDKLLEDFADLSEKFEEAQDELLANKRADEVLANV